MLDTLPLLLTLLVPAHLDAIDLTVLRGGNEVDQSNLESSSGSEVSLNQIVGQTVTVGVSGLLTGFEIAPLLDRGHPNNDELTLEIYDSLDQLLGAVTISAADFPLGGGAPDPLLADSIGPGFFELTELAILVDADETVSFALVATFEPGVCDAGSHTCTAGSATGEECFHDSQCEGSFRVGISGDEYPGGTILINGQPSLFPNDLAFKLFLTNGDSEDEVTLLWAGGEPSFSVLRSEDAETVDLLSNVLGETEGREWVDAAPAGELFFYHVTSDCVPDPPERCDGIDNDCDGTTDGPGSEISCDLAHATPVCIGGNCAIDSCDAGYDDCDDVNANGCEADLDVDPDNCGSCDEFCDLDHATSVCVSGLCVIDECDPGFDDCDADPTTGCETDIDSDTANCGACGAACDLDNASSTCTSGSCTITACETGFDNCDADHATGCETDIYDDADSCGSCGNTCMLPDATAGCSVGACFIVSCAPNFWDINADPVDGCEYACTFQSSLDYPDDAFVDSNCDGIDGDVAEAIFVATDGFNGWPGTRDQPKQTIQAGIDEASTSGRDVYISSGTYFETPSLKDGASLYGGYDRGSNWSRSSANETIIDGDSIAVTCIGVTAVTLDHLTIRADDAGPASASSYAVKLNGCSSIVIRRSDLQPGRGAAGNDGGNGTSGSLGQPGGNGRAGCEDSNIFCDSCSQPGPGSGGPGCYAGGRGGYPGHGTGNGSAGQSGSGPGGSGGSGGISDRDSNNGCGTPGATYNGRNGQDGYDGSSGSDGSGGSSFNSASTVSYNSSSGWAGTHGSCGGGGGGGGGGHGGDDDCDSYATSGGGGGGGGGSGFGGYGGSGGGGSFGVWAYLGTSVIVDSCVITTDHGGDGGSGGTGGNGGNGRSGGNGWIYGGSGDQDDAGCGGNGGDGGDGGRGGHGGGGGGGPSVGVVFRGCTGCSQSGSSFVLGAPGSGGASSGHNGATGLQTTVHSY